VHLTVKLNKLPLRIYPTGLNLNGSRIFFYCEKREVKTLVDCISSAFETARNDDFRWNKTGNV